MKTYTFNDTPLTFSKIFKSGKMSLLAMKRRYGILSQSTWKTAHGNIFFKLFPNWQKSSMKRPEVRLSYWKSYQSR